MTTFSGSDDLRGATFEGVDLRGARFVESDLAGVVMRGVEVAQVDIDAPWLPDGGFLRINGVDVIAFVEAELDRRFPGRADRRAADPAGLREAWGAVERAWAATLERAAELPPGAVDESVDGEWTFAQTLRHLVHATDLWVGRALLEQESLHPLGLGHAVIPEGEHPAYSDVLEARAGRVALVRDVVAAATSEQLDEARRNPHEPDRAETVRSCLHVILEEEWEHLRFAVRDLEAIEARSAAASHGDGLGGPT